VLANGTGAVSYSLDNSTFTDSGFFDNLAPDDYMLYIRDETGCVETIFIPLQDPTNFSFDGFEIVKDDCSDTPVGQITVLASGTDLTYSIDGENFQTSNVFSNLANAVYTVTIRNTNGCERIEQALVPKDGIQLGRFDIVNASCGGTEGSITVVAISDNPLTYSINDGPPQTSPTFSGLGPGVYSILIWDNTGCSLRRSAIVENTLEVSVAIVDANCNEENGSITTNLNQTGNYTYSIDGNNYQAGNVFSDLASGIYTVYVRDEVNGCVIETTASVGEIKSIDIQSVDVTPTICAAPTGTITINAIGSNLSYSIDDGATFSNSNVFTDLPVGSYTIVVKDVFECEEHATAAIVEENTVEIISIDTSISECAVPTGIIEITATGVGALSYSLDGVTFQPQNIFTDLFSGNHTVYVRDESGCEASSAAAVIENNDITITDIQVVAATGACIPDGEIEIIATGSNVEYSLDGINFQTSGLFQNLLPRTYVVYLRSDLGCVRETGSILIQGGYEVPEIIVTNTTCKEGLGTLEVTSRGPSIKYSLDNITYQTDGTFTDLEVGIYTIYVGDGEGCFITAEAEIINDGFVVIANVETTPTFCQEANGTIRIQASSENATLLEYSINGVDFQTDPEFTGVASGPITVTVRDDFGCTATSQVTVESSPPIEVSIETKSPICADSDGEIYLTTTGGTAPYKYSINGLQSQQESSFKNLVTGNYTITVEDALGCIFTTEVNLDRECIALLPTAIAPNGNGVNECFQLLYYTYVDITRYQIFDRWGILVYDGDSFNSIEHQMYWDGKVEGEVSQGVFMYNVSFVDERGEEKTMQGNVTVIR